MAHRKVSAQLPNPSDVLAGKVKTMETKEISAMYSLTVSLCYELKEASDKSDKKFDDKVNNFLRFAMDNFDTELVVMGIKLALTQYQLPIDPDEVECFDEFHERFGKLLKPHKEMVINILVTRGESFGSPHSFWLTNSIKYTIINI